MFVGLYGTVQFKFGIMKKLWALLTLVGTAQGAEPFAFDHQLAVDLSVAYVRSHFRQRPEHAVAGLSFEKPVVIGAIDNRKRHLVIVSFASPAGGGAYVVLEQCAENALLVAAESGTVDQIEHYRKDMASVTEKTFVAVPTICPGGGE